MVILGVFAPVFQEYVVTPDAFSVTLLPAQTVGLLTETVGEAFTVTVVVLEEGQVPLIE